MVNESLQVSSYPKGLECAPPVDMQGHQASARNQRAVHGSMVLYNDNVFKQKPLAMASPTLSDFQYKITSQVPSHGRFLKCE